MLKLHTPKLIVLLIFICSQSLKGQYFVSPAGSNENDGLSESTPWKTIDFALTAIMPDSNDTLFILPGNYEIEHSLYVFPGISLIGTGVDPSETTILCNSENIEIAFDLQNDNYGKGLKNDHFIFGNQLLKNFTLIGNKTAGKGIVATGRHNVTFSNLIVKDFTQGGIQLSAFKEYFVNNYDARKISGCEIAYCVLEENGSLEPTGDYSYFSNISIGGWQGGSLHHCTIIDTIADMNGSGMGIMGVERTKIHDNEIRINVYEKNHWGGIFSVVTGYTAGLEFFNNQVNSGISCENRVPYEHEIIPGVPDIMIFNNRFIGTHPNSVGIQAIELYNDNAEIFNNYFENFFHCITSWHGNDTVTNIDIHHNIFRGAGKGYAIHLTMGGTSYTDPANLSVYRNFKIYNNVFDNYRFAIYNPHGKADNFEVTNNVFMNLTEGVWEHTSEKNCNSIVFDHNLAYNHVKLQNNQSAEFSNTLTGIEPGFTLDGKRPGEWYKPSGTTSGVVDAGMDLGAYTAGFAGAAPDLGAYEFNGTEPVRLVSPCFSLPSGKYLGNQSLTIVNFNNDAQMIYTIDGSIPGTDNGHRYTSPIELQGPTIVKAIAIKENMISSAINEANYNICQERAGEVVFNPIGSDFNVPQIVELSSSTPNADIYFSVNGRLPNAATGQLYKGPFYLDSSLNIQAIAYGDDVFESLVSNAVYNLDLKIPDNGVVYNDTSSYFTWSSHYWAHKSGRGLGDYSDDIHVTYNEGSNFEFSFSGTGIAILSERNTDKTNSASIYIDDEFITTISLKHSSRVTSDTVFMHFGLSSGEHTIRMTHTGKSGNMGIDAIIVYGTAYTNACNAILEGINIYPQPANDYLVVTGLTPDIAHTVQVFDIQSKLTFSSFHPDGNKPVHINTNAWHPGIYLLKIQNKEGIILEQLIIE